MRRGAPEGEPKTSEDPDRLAPLGRPEGKPAEVSDVEQSDFSGEHEDTAVSKRITAGEDEREAESPKGWAGLEPDRRPIA
jgi:hypothetical protein